MHEHFSLVKNTLDATSGGYVAAWGLGWLAHVDWAQAAGLATTVWMAIRIGDWAYSRLKGKEVSSGE